jgi:ABC-2 type transport system permease protein
MIRNITTLIWNDLAIAFKNKTLYLILFIPLFVFVALEFVEPNNTNNQQIKIGLIQTEHYSPVMIQTIRSADNVFVVSWLSDEAEGRRWLKERLVDGMLVPSEDEPTRLALVVLKKESFQTLAIVESFSALQIAVEGRSKNWISAVKPLQASGIHKQTLPTWIVMLILLVGFIVIPAQVAEEKEKKVILGLLQTPMRETEWLLAKLLSGMILMNVAVILLQLPGKFAVGTGVGYIAFLIVGSFCFSSFGMCVGFLCRTQASARTLGVLFYLPHLLPPALSEFSPTLHKVAPLLPSYQLYGPIKGLLLEGDRLANFYLQWLYLLVVGLFTCLLSYLLMKKRWLM